MKRNMKKCRLFSIAECLMCLLLAASAASAASIQNEGADCTGETLIIDLSAGNPTLQLSAILPEDADQEVTWRSSDKSIATVSEDGLVTGVGQGTATITATSAGNAKEKAACKVMVTNLVKEIRITGSDTVAGGKVIALNAEVLPEEASDKTLSWISLDTEIAVVSSASGVVLAYKTEEVITATITASAKDGSGVTAAWDVTVRPPVQGASLMHDGVDCTSGMLTIDLASEQDSIQLTAVIAPADADQAVTWRSSDQDAASVSQDGVVTGLKDGTATIAAKSVSDAKVKVDCTVKVSYLAKKINITGNTVVVGGKETTLLTEVLPGETSIKTVTWESSDPEIAAVSSDGVITTQETKETKTVTITAAATDGSGVSTEWMITVYPAVEEVNLLHEGKDCTLDTLTIDLTSGPDTLQLGAAVYPAAADQSVIWGSSDESVATVSEDGTVTGIGKGTVTISATSVKGETDDGSAIKAFCKVNVVCLVKEITIIGPDTLTAGEEFTYTASILPKAASDAPLGWTIFQIIGIHDNPETPDEIECDKWILCPESIATFIDHSTGYISIQEDITEIYDLMFGVGTQDGSDVHDFFHIQVVPK